jgi:molecular chaperone DnaJ
MGAFGDVLNDLFGDLFGTRGGGGRSRRGRGRRGADLRYTLEVELKELLDVKETTIQIPKMRPCDTCNGSGAREGTRPEPCSRCRGAGQLMFQQGFFRISRPCDACGGAGEVVKERCVACRGAGRIEGEQTLHVKIPAGIEHGTRLRLAGEGEAGLDGGPPGDLYVDVAVRPHPLFERDGGDLHCQVPIPFVQAALGSEIEVPTLDGKETLGARRHPVRQDLPPARQGTALLGSRARGDQIVQIFVEVPSKLTERQRELLEHFARESGTEVSPVTKGFLDKLRDFLG